MKKFFIEKITKGAIKGWVLGAILIYLTSFLCGKPVYVPFISCLGLALVAYCAVRKQIQDYEFYYGEEFEDEQ